MHIYPKYTGPIRPETTRTSPAEQVADNEPVQPASPVPSGADRSDRVEISDAGRALSAREGEGRRGLDPARAAQIRGRVLSGAYDTLEVVDAVARRLLDSGDL
jgi:negative regulator of flagellin synthesis FlgM